MISNPSVINCANTTLRILAEFRAAGIDIQYPQPIQVHVGAGACHARTALIRR